MTGIGPLSVRPRIRRRSPGQQTAFKAVLPDLLQRILAARNVCDDESLGLEPHRLYPPSALKGMEQAVALLVSQLQAQAEGRGRILIVADFDADGATSCALLIRGLQSLGFSRPEYVVPNRFEFGYGLTPEIVNLAAKRHPDLIITVDNGISSVDGVETARALGIRVLITDHHLPGNRLPDADAIINPNQPGCGFPEKSLAGVGVAFYLLLALRARLREDRWFEKNGVAEPNLAGLLDLVALGTVADVVPLHRNNRILVNEGLRRIRAGRACAGIMAILEVAGREHEDLVAADLGYAVAPRLNAAGRLEDMSQGIECLIVDDPEQARLMADSLDTINHQRRSIEAEMRTRADSVLAEMKIDGAANGGLPAGLCLYDPGWHQGVVGILASRLKDALHRPVIVFADASDDEGRGAALKGSARSVPGLHIRDALEHVASQNPGLVSRFGGHAMAAGLSLDRCDLERFSGAFDQCVQQWLGDAVGQGTVMTDGELSADELALDTARMLRDAGPWGQAFPEPVFDGEFVILHQRLVAERHLKLVLALPEGSRELDAIAFNVDTDMWPDATVQRARMVYRLDVNRFRGQSRLQLIVELIEVP